MASGSPHKHIGFPLAEKAAASVKSTPLDFAGRELPTEVMRLLKKSLQRVGAEDLTDGAQIFSRHRKCFAQEFRGVSVAEAFEYADQVFGAVLRDATTFSATVP